MAQKNFYNPKRRPIHRIQRSRHAYTAFSRFNKGFFYEILVTTFWQTEAVRAKILVFASSFWAML